MPQVQHNTVNYLSLQSAPLVSKRLTAYTYHRSCAVTLPLPTVSGNYSYYVILTPGRQNVSAGVVQIGEWFVSSYRLLGLVVRRPPQERKVPSSNPAGAGIFSGSSHTSDSKIGTPVATLPGAWRYRVSAGTGWSGVSIL